METIGIFEAKTKFSEICERVSKSQEPVLVTRRGMPIVRIDPVPDTEGKSDIWTAREKFIKKYGPLDEDFETPGRTVDKYKNPFDE